MPESRLLHRLKTSALWLSAAAFCAGHTVAAEPSEMPQQEPERPVITVAVLDTMVNPFDAFLIQETLQALQANLPEYDIRSTTVVAAEADQQVKAIKPDFIFAPAAFSLLSSLETVRIATRKTHLAHNADESVGAAVVVRRDSTAHHLSDLKGKRIFTGLPTALDGWLAVKAEVKRTLKSSEDFFGSVSFRNNPYPDVISALYSGAADAAVLPACLLESIEARGLIEQGSVRVLDDKSDPEHGLACQHSTVLYPDVALLAFGSTPETLVRDVTIAILSLKNTAGSEWLTNVSHARVDALLKDLEMGPYAYLRDMSLKGLYTRHKTEVWLALSFVLLLILYEVRLHRLLTRRTRELTDVMNERERIREEAAHSRLQLAGFERRSIVQKMSSMIAHEINAPVGGIRTWAAIARLKCPALAFKDDKSQAKTELETALKHIDHEADRIAEIVSRVRGYVRKENQKPVRCDLTVILANAVRAFDAEENPAQRTAAKLTLSVSDAFVTGQPLELEILFLNLIRNAATALKAAYKSSAITEDAVVSVRLDAAGTSTPAWRITVENPGEKLSDESFALLTQKSASVSASPSSYGGLGLGLTICRGIADRHGASLAFERRETGGVRACVTIDADASEEQTNTNLEETP